MLRFHDVMTKGDWAKLIFLIIVAAILWGWVFIEYRKPFPVVADAAENVR